MLEAQHVLDVWQQGDSQDPLERSLTLLSCAQPAVEREQLARLPVGRRDAALLAFRKVSFGPTMAVCAECPACRQKVDLSLEADALLGGSEVASAGLEVESEGYQVQFRPVATADLQAVLQADQPRQELLRRCIVSCHRRGGAVALEELPAAVLDQVERCMQAADPLASVDLQLVCPDCEHVWEAAFDIVSQLWADVRIHARRLLREVHELASAYGWTEREILSLSQARRQEYLDLVRE